MAVETGNNLGRAASHERVDVEKDSSFKGWYSRFEAKAGIAMQLYFHDAFSRFQPPMLDRILGKFNQVAGTQFGESHIMKKEEELSEEEKVQMKALKREAAIRFVDDFIDEAFWPLIHTLPENDLRKDFENMLKACEKAAHEEGGTWPPGLIELPIMELDLELDPTQANFDDKIVKLFNKKSVNLWYIQKTMRGEDPAATFVDEAERLRFDALCVKDFRRDYTPENYLNEKDFNIRNYLDTHREINPAVLGKHVEEVITKLQAYVGSSQESISYPKTQASADLETCRQFIDKLQKKV